jgi:hypothetical protein
VGLDIQLSDLQAAGLASLNDIRQLIFAATPTGTSTLYVDNVYFYNDAGSGGTELAVNGDFETGDLTGWTDFANGGVIAVVSPGANGSSFAGSLDTTGIPTGVTLKQANLGAGSLTPGQQVTVSFDWKGSAAIGGVVNAVLFSELSGGGVSQTDTLLSTGAFPADWTTVGPTTVTIGSDVSGGVTLEVTAICGADAGCVSNLMIDNVSIVAQ